MSRPRLLAFAILAVLGCSERVWAAGPTFFVATLSGAQEVQPVASAGTGTGTVILNAAEDQITVNLTFSGLSMPANAAHIHGAAPAGQNAGVLFDFSGQVTGLTSGTITVQTFAITPTQVAELKAGLYYFNIHTANFGDGEIRGQVGLAGTQFTTTLTGAQQVPVVASSGTGTGIAALNAAETLLIVNLTFSGLSTPAILAHIHGAAPVGQNAGVLFDFSGPVNGLTAGTIPQQIFAITPAQVAEMKAGLWYFNVHTTNFGGGEIRGQISPPMVSLDRTSLRFAATNAGTSFAQQTPSQTVRILQAGLSTVAWSAAPNQPWLTVSPPSGSGSGVITVSVTPSATLPAVGTSNGSITLTFTGAANTAGPVTVALTTLAVGSGAPPSGLFETPLQGAAGITGSVAVTGWVVDDLGVTAVRVLRDPVAGEGSSLIFIGNAVLVDGSRTDIAQAFPNAPLNTRAGWGYLMLTNFLPNRGNGTFTLHAIADDVDGHSFELGTKTITCSNDFALKPFGAIDTPGQGETISGAAFPNFGWVLSRTPALAFPPNGTVQVVVDGVFLSQVPIGWVSRSDLTALFPVATYPGVANALGVATLDTTAMTNAVHTIAWVVTDNALQADGIGSRFFTVANGSGVALAPGARTARGSLTIDGVRAAPEHRVMAAIGNVDAAVLDTSPVVARRGFDLAAPLRGFAVSAAGRATIQGEELDRFEIHLAGDGPSPVAGYLRVGSALQPLPVGSHLDPETGVFTWQPGPGFLHAYDFVFVRAAAGRAPTRQEVRVVINAKGSNRVGPQVVIDTPGEVRLQPDVGQPFVVAGWAIDVDADWGTGVDTLHVWAYPHGTGQPIFLGAAAYGGRRPDVGAIFGDRFRESGYSLTVDSLPPGTYDLAVFAWSTATRGFVPAKVVRVVVR